jgi:hypothetical protein
MRTQMRAGYERPEPAPRPHLHVVKKTPERQKLEARVRVKRQLQLRAARTDPEAFAEYVMLDEVSQRPIRLSDLHREWHRFLSANPWAVLVAPVEHGKTVTLISRVLYEMGRNPNIRIGWISDSAEQALLVVGQIRRYIEESERLREVFPNLKRSTRPGHVWNQHALEIERSPFLRNPTLRAYGSGTKIAGARLDLIICDDILNLENTATLEACTKTQHWFDVIVLTRAQDDPETGARARLWVVGTPFSDNDILHELPKRKSFASRIFSCVENPDDAPDKWRPTWPEVWPLARLLTRLNGMLPSAFARKYLCRVVNDINSRFPEWTIKVAFEQGRGLTFQTRRPLIYPGPRALRCWTGVDLGVGEKEGDDLTALVTVALNEDRTRQIIDITTGHWTADEIMDRIEECYYRFESRIVVESVAAQRWLLQFVRKNKKIPVEPYNTTAQSKWDESFGIESLAVELRQKLWRFPSGKTGADYPAELWALRNEMMQYRPNKHTGDRLMAMWFAREGMRRTLGKKFR